MFYLGNMKVKEHTLPGGSNFKFGYAIQNGIDLTQSEYQIYKDTDEIYDVDAVHYPLIIREVFFRVGGFDHDYFYICDEMDIGARIRKLGYRNVICFGKYTKTDMTPESNKTIFYWNRNWLRMVIKMNRLMMIPIYCTYPIIKISSNILFLSLKRNNEIKRLLLKSLKYNFENVKRTRKTLNHNWLNELSPL